MPTTCTWLSSKLLDNRELIVCLKTAAPVTKQPVFFLLWLDWQNYFFIIKTKASNMAHPSVLPGSPGLNSLSL